MQQKAAALKALSDLSVSPQGTQAIEAGALAAVHEDQKLILVCGRYEERR